MGFTVTSNKYMQTKQKKKKKKNPHATRGKPSIGLDVVPQQRIRNDFSLSPNILSSQQAVLEDCCW
jgi:hypothetical protein